ncbi:NUO-3 protein [Aphelenchoides avenae]|nr:NUO-3 protein [Aphelenchus avenae]
MPLPVFRELLKTQFTKQGHLTDLRVIDRKVHETYAHIESFNMAYYNPDHVRNYLLRENVDPKPKDFLSKFLAGKD